MAIAKPARGLEVLCWVPNLPCRQHRIRRVPCEAGVEAFQAVLEPPDLLVEECLYIRGFWRQLRFSF